MAIHYKLVKVYLPMFVAFENSYRLGLDSPKFVFQMQFRLLFAKVYKIVYMIIFIALKYHPKPAYQL